MRQNLNLLFYFILYFFISHSLFTSWYWRSSECSYMYTYMYISLYIYLYVLVIQSRELVGMSECDPRLVSYLRRQMLLWDDFSDQKYSSFSIRWKVFISLFFFFFIYFVCISNNIRVGTIFVFPSPFVKKFRREKKIKGETKKEME